MVVNYFQDEWLTATVEELIGREKLEELRHAETVAASLWETVVSAELVTHEQLLAGLSVRCRLAMAELSESDPEARDVVPEQVARRYNILPLRITNSILEVATANPFDLDCEKTLAFATGREVRISLASPVEIGRRIDELYRPDNVIDQILEGIGTSTEITQIDEDGDTEEITVSAEEASQRPVVRLVDLILSEGILARSSDVHIEPEEGGVATVPDRWGAAAGDETAAGCRPPGDLAHQDHLRSRYRRPATPSGRPRSRGRERGAR